MTSQQLPERPSLEHLKKLAKALLRDAQAQDPAALARFRILPAGLGALSLALHDAQSVIAREHGFASWNALREHVEERTLTFEAAVDEFVRCATGDAPGRARRLLALHPGIAHANLQAELVLGDVAAVEARLRKHPELANQRGGVQDWEPVLYLCHTSLHRHAEVSAADLVEIARELLRLGADPNVQYRWRWHAELPRTPLWGALCVLRHLPLAEALLEGGAKATDGVALHIAAGGGDLPVLELLGRHGAGVDGIPGGVPPLVYILGWATDAAGPRWLLEHGADANLVWAESGEAPLHVAARCWDVPMLEMLARHGADLSLRRADGRSAHTLGALHGNHAVASWLLERGAVDELSPLESFVAACARGDRPGSEALLRADPQLRTQLRAEHHLMLHRPAESGRADVLEAMLGCGFDPGARDKENVTALHRAAMAGHPQAVRLLLSFGAPVDALDGMFSATPLVWAVEGWRNQRGPGADHVRVAQLLLAAGSPTERAPPSGAPDPEGTLGLLVELRREADTSCEPGGSRDQA